MAQNKNALIRYKTIDKCLQNAYRNWTLNDLIEACSEALHEYEGRDVNVSKRTVQLDIQLMRSDKLGYNAPIEVYDKKFYRYENPDYSITDIPLNESDMNVLSETVEMLKQFKDFSLFSELGGIIQRLEDKIYTEKTHQPSIIHLDKNEHLKGLEHLDVLYQAIIKKMVLKIVYQSFKAREASELTIHPFILKEFNNRWFLVGKKNKKSPILTLALDRIQSIDYDLDIDYIDVPFDGDAYYANSIGVTVIDAQFVQRVVLKIDSTNAPYVLTKPLHHSQELIEKQDNGSVVIALRVHENFELERVILGFGNSMQVLEPSSLRRRVQERLEHGLDQYRTTLGPKSLITTKRKLEKNGYGILNDLYTRREVKKMRRVLDQYFKQHDETAFGKRKLLLDIPELKEILFSENMVQLIASIDKNAFLCKAMYFDKPASDNWYVTWHQDVPINVTEKIETDGYQSWTHKKGIDSVCPPEEILHSTFSVRVHLDDTHELNGALHIVPGSFKKRFSDAEVRTITDNCLPVTCNVHEGGVHIMKPLLLHASSKSKTQKKRRVIHLEFTSKELPGKLEWLERTSVIS
jgi:predicted DNA-binding transcriptional regulator YafY